MKICKDGQKERRLESELSHISGFNDLRDRQVKVSLNDCIFPLSLTFDIAGNRFRRNRYAPGLS